MGTLTSLLCLAFLCCLWSLDYFPSPSGIPASFSLQMQVPVVLELQPFVQWLFKFMVAPYLPLVLKLWPLQYGHIHLIKIGALGSLPILMTAGALRLPPSAYLLLSVHFWTPALHGHCCLADLPHLLAPTALACLPWSFSRKLLAPESFLPKVRHRYFLAKPGEDGLMCKGPRQVNFISTKKSKKTAKGS